MNCSGLAEPIGDSLPWGMLRNEDHIQIAFGSGEGGFVIFTRAEAGALLEHIQREGGATICGQQLRDDQATELTGVLEELLTYDK